MANLKTDYKDDILDVSKNVNRKYQMINNADGTVSFIDVTEYSQEGSLFGANDLNATNGLVNELNSKIDSINPAIFIDTSNVIIPSTYKGNTGTSVELDINEDGLFCFTIAGNYQSPSIDGVGFSWSPIPVKKGSKIVIGNGSGGISYVMYGLK